MDALERRQERDYDECDGSRLLHSNGSRLRCGDRELTAVLVREVLALTRKGATPQPVHEPCDHFATGTRV